MLFAESFWPLAQSCNAFGSYWAKLSNLLPTFSDHHFANDASSDICQSKVSSRMIVRQLFMVDPQECK